MSTLACRPAFGLRTDLNAFLVLICLKSFTPAGPARLSIAAPQTEAMPLFR
jgi:hypothetical protein